MNDQDRRAAEFDIEKQIKRFYVALDEREFETMAAVMAPDGNWRRAGVDLRGRAGLLAEMSKRPADRHSRHQVTNVLVDLDGDDRATARFYSTAWVHLGPADDKGVAPMELPSSIGVLTARFVRTDEGWLLEDLRSKPAFKRSK